MHDSCSNVVQMGSVCVVNPPADTLKRMLTSAPMGTVLDCFYSLSEQSLNEFI